MGAKSGRPPPAIYVWDLHVMPCKGERVREKKKKWLAGNLQGATLLVNMTEALLLLALLEQAGGGQNQEPVDACCDSREIST